MSCCVCFYSEFKSKEKRKFYKIPAEETVRQQWLAILPPSCLSKANPTVCSIHFKKDDFETSSLITSDSKSRRRLKKSAVPSVFSGDENVESSLIAAPTVYNRATRIPFITEQTNEDVAVQHSSITEVTPVFDFESSTDIEYKCTSSTWSVNIGQPNEEQCSSMECMPENDLTEVTQTVDLQSNKGSENINANTLNSIRFMNDVINTELVPEDNCITWDWKSLIPPDWKVIDDDDPNTLSVIELTRRKDLDYFVSKAVRIDVIHMNITKFFMGTVVASAESEPNPAPFYSELDVKILLKSFHMQKTCGGLDGRKYGEMLTSCTRGKKIENTWFSNSCQLLAERCFNECSECRKLKDVLRHKVRRGILVSKTPDKRTNLSVLSQAELRDRCQDQAKTIKTEGK